MRIPKRKGEGDYSNDDGGPIYLTKEGIEKIKKTLHLLETVEHPQARRDVERTGQFGDFSENAEYQEAKSRMRHHEKRIFYLKEKLKRAVEIKMGSEMGLVQIGSTVIVEVGGQKKTFQIVGPSETDPSGGRISHISPLGKILEGHIAGDSVVLKIGNRETVYKILEVR